MNLSEAMLFLDKKERDQIKKIINEYDDVSKMIETETDKRKRMSLILRKRRLQKKASLIIARLYIIAKENG